MVSNLRALLLVIPLAGCGAVDFGEVVDQGAHYGWGRFMACDAVRGFDGYTPEMAIEWTMDFARLREEQQHPGTCGGGCQLDLEWWQRGAERGAQCGD